MKLHLPMLCLLASAIALAQNAGPTAPPHGLYFASVSYPQS